MKNELQLEVYYGTRPPWPNTTLLFSGDQALVVDTQFQKTDARAVAQRIKDAGKTLTTILITHSHPDHAWGGAELLKIFPEAKAYARPASILELECEFRARQLRWTGIFDEELPESMFHVEPLEGDVFDFDGHTIELIDSKPSETLHLMTCYVPEIKTYIASDQIYNRCHYYLAPGLNRPDLWIESIKDIADNYDIKRVVPGHGAVGGTEVFDEAFEYLNFYQEISKPFVPHIDIVHALLEKYPDWKMEGVIYMTIGPAMTAQDLIDETGGKTSFGSGAPVSGYYRAER